VGDLNLFYGGKRDGLNLKREYLKEECLYMELRRKRYLYLKE
jgi:hypothetical protein